MKKLISIILSAVMLLSAIITVNAASFKDVKSSDWYYSSVNYVSDKSIMQGTSSTKFSPKASLTRAMGVTLLYRVAGSPSVSGVNIPFTDVKGGQWYTDAVKWAYKNGIVTGKSNTYFDTNGNITRAEFATILNRYSDFQNYTLPSTRSDFVTDVAKIPSWAFVSVNTMYKAEIINGRNGGVFDPNAKISRAEAAAMIERFMKAPKNAGSSSTPDKPIETPEVPTTGKLVIKEKKYDYNGANVMILNVENQTSKDLNVTISAKYLDASGKLVYAENRMIEGFPANYQNYVVLQPGIKFDKFTYEVKTSKYNGEVFMKYIIKEPSVIVKAIPCSFDQMKDTVRAEVQVTYSLDTKYELDLFYFADFVLFDNKGEIYHIKNNHPSIINNNLRGQKLVSIIYDDILYKDFVMPDNLKGNCSGIVALKEVTQEMPNIW